VSGGAGVTQRRPARHTRITERRLSVGGNVTLEEFLDVFSQSCVAAGSVDVVLLVFVLSALSPASMPFALDNIKATLRRSPASRVFLRDYAAGDLAEQRFDQKSRQKIEDNFYVRGDGTVRGLGCGVI
jgi:hypothetical protein